MGFAVNDLRLAKLAAFRAVLEFKTHSRSHAAMPFKEGCRLSSADRLKDGSQPFENRYDLRS
jgi:hypothetical protein